MSSDERSWKVALHAVADSVEITVYDVIGKTIFSDGLTAKDFIAKLRATSARRIVLRVNSVGGLIDEAKAMVNLLRERAASGIEVVAKVDGLAASAASYLLTAASHVEMPANAFQMLHGVRGSVYGTAKDMDAAAILFRRTNEQMAEAYAAASVRRGKMKSAADFLAMFASGDTYLDADQAIEYGLADSRAGELKMAASLADLKDLVGVPATLANAPYVARQDAKVIPIIRATTNMQSESRLTPEQMAIAQQLFVEMAAPLTASEKDVCGKLGLSEGEYKEERDRALGKALPGWHAGMEHGLSAAEVQVAQTLGMSLDVFAQTKAKASA